MSGEVDPKKKTHLFVEKCIEDVRQDEKHVPDLLELIIQPPGLVKEELRQKLFKINEFDSKIKKIRVCTFQMSGKIPGFDQRNLRGSNFNPLCAIFGRASGQIFKKCEF